MVRAAKKLLWDLGRSSFAIRKEVYNFYSSLPAFFRKPSHMTNLVFHDILQIDSSYPFLFFDRLIFYFFSFASCAVRQNKREPFNGRHFHEIWWTHGMVGRTSFDPEENSPPNISTVLFSSSQ